MQAEPLGSRARRILAEMGIDVWQLRRPGDGTDGVPMAESVVAGAVPEPAPARVLPAAATVSARADVSAETGNPTSPGKGRTIQPAEERVAPFTVLCLSRPGALLLIEPVDSRAARRFASDLLAAVSGSWGGETRQLAFEWPQRGIEQSAAAVARALDAFVRKQLADNEGSLVLVDAQVVARLDAATLPQECLRIGSFEALMTDGKLKRALWRDMGQYRGR